MAGKQPAVYILASGPRGTLYVGVTGNLKLRIWEHREGMVAGFTKRYGVKMLVWYELHADFPSAIKRETQLKKWNRAWKLELIESTNQDWVIFGTTWLNSQAQWIPACAGMTSGL